VDDAHLMQARRGMISSVVTRPVHPNAVPLHPMAIGGKLSPSQSEPDLANPTRWRSQRQIHDEPSADLRNLESEPVPLRPMTEGLHSSTSCSEHPPTHLKKFQRVLSEGRMIPSPEHPVSRPRAPSMLSGSRRHGAEYFSISRCAHLSPSLKAVSKDMYSTSFSER
jgi:hypothetical protein